MVVEAQPSTAIRRHNFAAPRCGFSEAKPTADDHEHGEKKGKSKRVGHIVHRSSQIDRGECRHCNRFPTTVHTGGSLTAPARRESSAPQATVPSSAFKIAFYAGTLCYCHGSGVIKVRSQQPPKHQWQRRVLPESRGSCQELCGIRVHPKSLLTRIQPEILHGVEGDLADHELLQCMSRAYRGCLRYGAEMQSRCCLLAPSHQST
ncbi:hypothetical protein HPB51_028017 [Rhipicephalus microplus]|uniref:Uncharacterized protein n=1 Tax=Rhipicephalus microplus TaxID=6941 RepID=A0A9J6CYG7_RHIMP|nr:hypothetical protein HPB51_028017 [Rhipicephalus microplus]